MKINKKNALMISAIIALLVLVIISIIRIPGHDYHIGQWNQYKNEEVKLVINTDKTYLYYKNNMPLEKGKYKVAKKSDSYVEISIKRSDDNIGSSFRAYDNIMINYKNIYRFNRYRTDGISFKEGLYGPWFCLGESRILNIYSDGTISFGMEDHYIYETKGNAYIIIDSNYGDIISAFEYDGDNIYLMTGEIYMKAGI